LRSALAPASAAQILFLGLFGGFGAVRSSAALFLLAFSERRWAVAAPRGGRPRYGGAAAYWSWRSWRWPLFSHDALRQSTGGYLNSFWSWPAKRRVVYAWPRQRRQKDGSYRFLAAELVPLSHGGKSRMVPDAPAPARRRPSGAGSDRERLHAAQGRHRLSPAKKKKKHRLGVDRSQRRPAWRRA